ncbi:hypothetical protein PITC_088510 [Penicillium italicum]|uniref:Uncharacterized protein n=1 Tax=Penicillium italicum TaxID=40296 RepID=A0A0A2L8Z2_PENIT|nr:hypothetical protein PITC_088510 [Penicillium italicum]
MARSFGGRERRYLPKIRMTLRQRDKCTDLVELEGGAKKEVAKVIMDGF